MPRQDDPNIFGEIALLRRIPPTAERVQWEDGMPIASTANFDDKDGELSVFIEIETTFDAVLAGHAGFGLVRFSAGAVREICGESIIICRDPLDPPEPPGHALICGKPTRSMRRRLKAQAQWVEGRWPAQIDPVTGQVIHP
jgi:hypothetical protein